MMTFHFTPANVSQLFAGAAILIKPNWLSYFVAFFLIIMGALGITGIPIHNAFSYITPS